MAATVSAAPAAPSSPGRAIGRPAPRWLGAILSVPLPAKLAGANAVIVAGALVAAYTAHGSGSEHVRMLQILGSALAAGFVANLALVLLALRPLMALETTAERVYRGDLAARVGPSLLADRDVARIGGTLNLLLDALADDRRRTRLLASEVIRAGDEERAYLARELHDSTAQTLAAMMYQLSAVARDTTDPDAARRLEEVRALAATAIDELRVLAQAAHPRVLDDLGLEAALRQLARHSARETVEIEVVAHGDGARLPRDAASVLYRVAQEAVANSVRHAAARRGELQLDARNDWATLAVTDDGSGFDVADAERRRPGMGLFTMRERVRLLDGRFEVQSRPGAGTRVTASVPATAPHDGRTLAAEQA